MDGLQARVLGPRLLYAAFIFTKTTFQDCDHAFFSSIFSSTQPEPALVRLLR
jgi:hypothetical protein